MSQPTTTPEPDRYEGEAERIAAAYREAFDAWGDAALEAVEAERQHAGCPGPGRCDADDCDCACHEDAFPA